MNRSMRCTVVFFVICALLISPLSAVQAQGGGPDDLAPLSIGPGQVIPNHYIVVLKAGSGAAIQSAAAGTVKAMGGRVIFQYGSALKGFAAQLPDKALMALRKNPQVAYIEADQVVSIDPVAEVSQGDAGAGLDGGIGALATQAPATWGLDRVDQRALPLNNAYSFDQNGAGVHVYVVDTGIRSTHVFFQGRASKDFDAIGDGLNGDDCYGHGTHVAGTVGSSKYGVAKAVRLHSVRVLDCSGSGSYAGVIAGINYVVANGQKPAVINMSLGGGKSAALNDAVAAAVGKGITVVVAAGNSAANACNFSPASAPSAITVGATYVNDERSYFSNWGACLDIFAPGSDITSTYIIDDLSTATMSGTSMASPHVAGVAALILQVYPSASPATVTNKLINLSTKNKVTDVLGAPNRLLYSRLNLTVPVPLNPSGVITNTRPAFSWIKAGSATRYQLLVYKDGALLFSSAVLSSVCGTSLCAIQSPRVLTGGNYAWKVRAMIGGVWKPFSIIKTFSIAP